MRKAIKEDERRPFEKELFIRYIALRQIAADEYTDYESIAFK